MATETDKIGVDSLYYWLDQAAGKALLTGPTIMKVSAAATDATRVKDLTEGGNIAFVPGTISYTVKGERVARKKFIGGEVSDITFEVVANDADAWQKAIFDATAPIVGVMIKKKPKNPSVPTDKDSYTVIEGALFGYDEADPNGDIVRFVTTMTVSGKPKKYRDA